MQNFFVFIIAVFFLFFHNRNVPSSSVTNAVLCDCLLI